MPPGVCECVKLLYGVSQKDNLSFAEFVLYTPLRSARVAMPRGKQAKLPRGKPFSGSSEDIHIGVGRFRILGGPNSQQAHDVVMTSMRRNDVASTSFRRHVPSRFLINQCQIITILILKSDIIENSG